MPPLVGLDESLTSKGVSTRLEKEKAMKRIVSRVALIVFAFVLLGACAEIGRVALPPAEGEKPIAVPFGKVINKSFLPEYQDKLIVTEGVIIHVNSGIMDDLPLGYRNNGYVRFSAMDAQQPCMNFVIVKDQTDLVYSLMKSHGRARIVARVQENPETTTCNLFHVFELTPLKDGE